MRKISIGDHVTTNRPIEAYYSGYAGSPVRAFEPGMVGKVQTVDCPSVCRPNVTFMVVQFRSPVTGNNERCAMLPDDVATVE